MLCIDFFLKFKKDSKKNRQRHILQQLILKHSKSNKRIFLIKQFKKLLEVKIMNSKIEQLHPNTGLENPNIKLFMVMAVVFVEFFIVGIAVPVLPLYVNQNLGLSSFFVGLVVGCQFATTLISRFGIGHFADSKGSKFVLLLGMFISIISGACYFGSILFESSVNLSLTFLFIGRALFGVAESCTTVGALSWGVSFVGPQRTGKVMAWVGMAIFGGMAIAAPISTELYKIYNFNAVALITLLLPILCIFILLPLKGNRPQHAVKPAFAKVLKAIWLPGIGLTFSSIGFGVITTFAALFFAKYHWDMLWLVFTSYSIAFILARVFFGSLADKIGGAKLAFSCVLIEVFGLILIAIASIPALVFIGAAFTGFGYSLVFPGFGVEAVHRAPAQNRALAMGLYSGFMDLAIGLSSPLLGLLAKGAGLRSVFVSSVFIVFSALIVAFLLLRQQKRKNS